MSALRNLLIVGGVVVGGALAYRFARQRYFSGDVQQDYAPPKPVASKPGAVSADQLVTARTGTAITKREKGMQYFPILSTRSVGGVIERTFRPTIDGYYTGRILNQAKKLYAEVQPAGSSLSGFKSDYVMPTTEAIQVLQNLTSLVRGSKTGKGERRGLARQLVAAKRAARNTPEYRALHESCKVRLNELNYMNDLMNQREIYWEMTPDILTGNCRFMQIHTYGGGGGGD